MVQRGYHPFTTDEAAAAAQYILEKHGISLDEQKLLDLTNRTRLRMWEKEEKFPAASCEVFEEALIYARNAEEVKIQDAYRAGMGKMMSDRNHGRFHSWGIPKQKSEHKSDATVYEDKTGKQGRTGQLKFKT